MNYGYDCIGWTEEKKKRLAEELEKLLESAEYVAPHKAYVEVNGPYGGVRLRAITWMTDASRDSIIDESDRICTEILRGNPIKGKLANDNEIVKYVVVELYEGLVNEISVFETFHDAQDRLMTLEYRDESKGLAVYAGSVIYAITKDNKAILQ